MITRERFLYIYQYVIHNIILISYNFILSSFNFQKHLSSLNIGFYGNYFDID